MSSLVGPDEDDPSGKPPVPDEVQEAVRTLIRRVMGTFRRDDKSRQEVLKLMGY